MVLHGALVDAVEDHGGCSVIIDPLRSTIDKGLIKSVLLPKAPDDSLSTIRSWRITKVEFVKTTDSVFIPKALRLPFVVGTMGILYGEK